MRFVMFSENGNDNRPGVIDPTGEEIIDLQVEGIGGDLMALIDQGEKGLDAVRRAMEHPKRTVALAEATLGAPIARPRRNIMCVGKNYFEHSKEFEKSGFDSTSGGQAVPDAPVIFTKAPSTVAAPGAAIPSHLDPTRSTDYEGELGVVIAKGGRRIANADAYGHVFGYVIINDVTARKLQNVHKQWFLGKSVDGYCPMGPYLVTADEVGDVSKLVLTTEVNGEMRQKGVVADLIFDIPTIIETISRTMTLEPGDIIATGTPAGVGIGFDPPKFLKPGDVVRVAITGLGVLESPVA